MTLPWARIVLRTVSKRSFHTTKRTSLFHEWPDKEGYQQKSDEEKEWEQLSFKKRLLLEWKLMKIGIKEWAEQLASGAIRGPRLLMGEGEVDVVWRFKGAPNELKEWIVTTDKDNNIGFSTAQLDFTPQSKGLFHGFLDTKVPPDGEIKNTGYCNLRLTPRLTPFKSKEQLDWSSFTHIVFRVRGDGRIYAVNLHLHRVTDICMYDTYHYFIWTRGGPYWQYVRIPFSKFLFAYKGRIQAGNPPIPLNEMSTISFTIADQITGPFRFEIDFIGLEYDHSHIEEHAYEKYQFDQKFY
ncbi:complex I intermediate-associated protein 30, mitochondrial [Nasonia vitripennis]|uniref:NADH:ubiquinone oxidoreductase intermediate-associated protein 30 domain-containing protein n=1 Tax=Nasonia vitripennis TaxID=7425 RepID=A0A7M7HD44_NASVI|nr:complex I intermediate-associated protein 30, mitochondrial [Nasonia vitripennis]XP_008211638.1 complex I intermediate-associated protein 30, mitochondrial [Nasonia vitripennis]XP_031784474.1 complex I intermediate-associated protein 30, mitochondrial [Nasonia vitripennis]XP_032455794.1 complex I intermediate-associated protein 30, mitochondrial [Nasonia vitripennis]